MSAQVNELVNTAMSSISSRRDVLASQVENLLTGRSCNEDAKDAVDNEARLKQQIDEGTRALEALILVREPDPDTQGYLFMHSIF